jgi:hypothetical protein
VIGNFSFLIWSYEIGHTACCRVPGRRAPRSFTLIVLRRSRSNRRQRGSSRQCDDDRKAHGVSLHEQSYVLTFFQIMHGIIWTPAGSCARQNAAGNTIYNQQAHKGRAGPLNEKTPAGLGLTGAKSVAIQCLTIQADCSAGVNNR